MHFARDHTPSPFGCSPKWKIKAIYTQVHHHDQKIAENFQTPVVVHSTTVFGTILSNHKISNLVPGRPIPPSLRWDSTSNRQDVYFLDETNHRLLCITTEPETHSGFFFGARSHKFHSHTQALSASKPSGLTTWPCFVACEGYASFIDGLRNSSWSLPSCMPACLTFFLWCFVFGRRRVFYCCWSWMRRNAVLGLRVNRQAGKEMGPTCRGIVLLRHRSWHCIL